MKIKKDDLVVALDHARKFAMKGGSLPICQKVLFDAENQRLMATDLDTSVYVPLEMTDYSRQIAVPVATVDLSDKKKDELVKMCKDADVPVSKKDTKASLLEKLPTAKAEKSRTFVESFCVNPGDLLNMVKTTESDIITMTVEQNVGENLFNATDYRLTIGENFKSIYVMSADEFPRVNIPEIKHTVDLERSQIQKVLVITEDKDTTSDRMAAVLFDGKKNRLVKTDGHRLHMLDIKLDMDEQQILVPSEALKKVISAGKNETISVSCSEKFTKLQVNGIIAVTRNVEGKYVDYETVLDSKRPVKVTVKKDALEKACDQALILISNMYQGAKFTFNEGISVEVINPDKGNYEKMDIPLKRRIDPPIEVGLNMRFVRDALRGIDNENVTIRMHRDKSTALVFTGHCNFTGLVMPMRI